VPIAASLVMAGMPLGTAMVFLMAGPATNVATIGAIYRTLGLKLLMVYLGTLIFMSILFALLFEAMFSDQIVVAMHRHGDDLLGIISTIALGLVTAWLYHYRHQQKQIKLQQFVENDMGITLNVEGMSCGHCVANVKKSLEALDGVEEATPDLDTGKVLIDGDNLDNELLKKAVTDAGYVVKD
jgi:hypothetical protein